MGKCLKIHRVLWVGVFVLAQSPAVHSRQISPPVENGELMLEEGHLRIRTVEDLLWIDAKNVETVQLLKEIARKARIAFQADEGVRGKISLKISRASMEV